MSNLKNGKPCRRCGGNGAEPDHVATGMAMRSLRETRKLSLRWMAGNMCLSAAYLSDLELGKRNWTPALIARFKKAL